MQLKEVKEYHDNGNLWMHYFLDEQERVQGKYSRYYIDGVTISNEANFKDDERHGKCIIYYTDSTIRHIIYFWHDKKVTKAEFLKLKLESIQ